MKYKLFPNIKRMTNLFCVGIACITVSALALRLTVFSDMAAAPAVQTITSMLTSEQDGYTINGKIRFSSADSKGDIFVTNLEGNEFVISVDITLEDNGKSILSTGYIKPGDSVSSKKMNPVGQKLEDGEYRCIAEITAHNPDDLKPVGSAKENVTVTIGNVEKDSTEKSKDETSAGKSGT